MRAIAILVGAVSVSLFAVGCGGGSTGGGGPGGGGGGSGSPVDETPVAVTLALPAGGQAELERLVDEVRALDGLGTEEFLDACRLPFRDGITFDPLAADRLDLIQSSRLALDAREQSALQANGFVISDRHGFGSFVEGYRQIYSADLPVYVSADSILHALHRSYDSMLAEIETSALGPGIRDLLAAMHQRLGKKGVPGPGEWATGDVDVYLAVARGLLDGDDVALAAGGDAPLARSLRKKCTQASGVQTVTLFGVRREIDFSQFTPRGHYTKSPALERYFRAMMWLGRIDFRIVETTPEHEQLFRRRQLEAAFALRDLMNESNLGAWREIEGVLRLLVGEQDNLTLDGLDELLTSLGVADAAALADIPDDRLAQAVIDGGYGAQRIATHLMRNGIAGTTLPLNRSFLLFGQRYVVDSEVFVNVVYDRVQGGAVYRMMPDPLDAAYAAFGNDHAGLLLESEIDEYGYAPDLAAMRSMVDGNTPDFWDGSLYNLWLSAIRELSPRADEVVDPAAAGLPRLMATEPWARRSLNAQLASWAELRHDTVLCAKQSSTGGATCEYPDAYVEPNPDFFLAVMEYAGRGEELADALPGGDEALADKVSAYFQTTRGAAEIHYEMATRERADEPLDDQHLAFINDAVVISGGVCGGPLVYDGWYVDLFYDRAHGSEYDPEITDVHTQPTDEFGGLVGKILHVGTGKPRLLVLTIDTGSGPCAYAGLASAYFEKITRDFQRLRDEDWKVMVGKGEPVDVPWMEDIIVR